MDEKRVFDLFKTSNWNSLSELERLNLLRQVEMIQAKKQGRQAVEIRFDRDLQGFGAYSSSDQRIILGKEAVAPNGYKRNVKTNQWEYFPANYEALDTVIHEGHHREQDLLARGDKNIMPFLDGQLRQDIANSWKSNFRHYSIPSEKKIDRTSFEEYYFQPIELDTVERTYQEMLWNDRLYNEPDYQQFIAEKKDSMQLLRAEALKTYGPSYLKNLEELKQVREHNPYLATRMENEYRQNREVYERENQRFRER